MIKRIFILTAIFLWAISGSVFAAEQEVLFKEMGGGKFIYCNNPESVDREDLADVSNPEPTLLMQNDDLKAGKYVLYAFHLNNTSVRNERNNAIEPGFDIELDVRFSTKTGGRIKINRLAYEVPIRSRVSDITYMDAWATYLQIPIKEVSTEKMYVPIEFEPVEIELDSAGSDWLSRYIENYCPVPYRKGVNLMADFEIIEGTINADVAALRSNPTLRDRSNFDVNAKRGILNKENQYKGIADTLPVVTADLNFVFDAKSPVDKPIMVKIRNQYVEQGRPVDQWMTNINPQADRAAVNYAVESDMLKFEFYDGMKLGYYDDSIPAEQRDEIWRIDAYHSDSMEGNPNRELTVYDYDLHKDKEIACNLANYGVRTQYRITATNNANVGKSFDYYVSTKSSDIVYGYEENKLPANPFAVYKDKTDSADKVLMYSIWLEPGSTKKFIIENILPTDVAGGTINSIYLSNEKKENAVLHKALFKKAEIFKPNAYADKQIGNFAKTIFDGNINNYDIIPKDQKYYVRWNAYDDVKGAINKLIVEFFSRVYIFDEKFELITAKRLDGLPAKNNFSGVNIQLGKKLLSFEEVDENKNILMVSEKEVSSKYGIESSDRILLPDTGAVMISNEIDKKPKNPTQYPVMENGRILVPIRTFFEAVGAKVEWDEASKTATITHLEKTIKIQVDNNQVEVDGKSIHTDIPARQINSRIMVPLRFVAEELNYSVEWESNINWVTLTPQVKK